MIVRDIAINISSNLAGGEDLVFDPASISGLIQWLDADDTDTINESAGDISDWFDKSTANNDVAQVTGANQPTYVTDEINDRNIVRFNGSTHYMTGSPFLLDTGTATIFAVIKAPLQADGVIIHSGNLAGPGTFYQIAAKASVPSVGIRNFFRNDASTTLQNLLGSATLFDDTTRILTFTDSLLIMKTRVDGVDDTSAGYSRFGVITDNGFTLGAAEAGGIIAHLDGDLCEIIIYDRVLVGSEIDQVEEYLADKWGTTLSFMPTDISGLIQWLDADDASTVTESGGFISDWVDKSIEANDVTQLTGADQPLYVTGEINGRNIVRFDGISDHLSGAPFLLDAGTATIFVVIKAPAQADGVIIHSGAGGAADTFYRIAAPLFFVGGNVRNFFRNEAGDVLQNLIGVATLFDDTARILTFTDSLLVMGTRIDGVDDILDSYSRTGVITDNAYTLGTSLVSGGILDPLDGDICEIVIYDRVLSALEIDTIEVYLADRWDVTLP